MAAPIATLERIAAAEMSAELREMLDSVAEATVRGAPKYQADVVRELTRVIVCRTYSGIIFELTHLMATAYLAFRGRGYEQLFWDQGQATPRRFRAGFERALSHAHEGADRVFPAANGIEAAYSDGPFAVNYSRMPLLSAMLDFLVAAIGYQAVDEAIRNALDPEPSRASLKRAANRMSKALYGYLKPRLPSAQAQRKFRCLMAFLRTRAAASHPRPDDIDDQAVAAFWREHAGDDDGDWKTFRATVMAFIHLRDALAAASEWTRLSETLPLDPARDGEPPDAENVLAACAAIDDRKAPLEALAENPAAAVKFLTKREAEQIAMTVAAGDHARALPLSILRAAVFGAVQAAITQSLRQGRCGSDAVSHACRDEGESYSARLEALNAVATHLEKVLGAAYHVLAQARHAEAITVFLALNPDVDLRPLAKAAAGAPAGGNVVALGAEDAARAFFTGGDDANGDCPGMADFSGRAAAAHRSILRKGFGAQEARDPRIIEGFAAGAPALLKLRGDLGRYLALIEALLPSPRDLERATLADRSFFFTQFRMLYGGNT